MPSAISQKAAYAWDRPLWAGCWTCLRTTGILKVLWVRRWLNIKKILGLRGTLCRFGLRAACMLWFCGVMRQFLPQPIPQHRAGRRVASGFIGHAENTSGFLAGLDAPAAPDKRSPAQCRTDRHGTRGTALFQPSDRTVRAWCKRRTKPNVGSFRAFGSRHSNWPR